MSDLNIDDVISTVLHYIFVWLTTFHMLCVRHMMRMRILVP